MVDSMRVILADDEPLARQRLRRLLGDEDGVELVAECEDGPGTLEAVLRLAPELLFLDIQLPELDGFGVLAGIPPDRMPLVIFVTAYDQHALRAFEVRALDYLVKPFDAERLHGALVRARRELAASTSRADQSRLSDLVRHLATEQRELERTLLRSGDRFLQRVMLRTQGRVFFIRTADIDWIEAAGNYVRLHSGKEAHLLRVTMNALEHRLDPEHFLRIHRSTIVNIERVRELHPWPSGEYTVVLRDGNRLKLSRGFRERLAERMGSVL
ncbi:MAG TPA: LytTR family DNA-binding domain-containing protein [Gemmatimonadaceae bacterium]|nr:LytTR family DNA-binding domain-containing protein [Gemmatimonadaceae bacterium]